MRTFVVATSLMIILGCSPERRGISYADLPRDPPDFVYNAERWAPPSGSEAPVAKNVANIPYDQRANSSPRFPEIAALPGGIRLLIPGKRFATTRSGSTRVSFNDLDLLKVLNMHPVPPDATSYFPEWLSELHGKQVIIRGFMIPTFKAEGLERFTLAKDNEICCFGRIPLVYDIIRVELLAGTSTNYIYGKPFDVEGVFKIALDSEDGEVFGLYELNEAEILR